MSNYAPMATLGRTIERRPLLDFLFAAGYDDSLLREEFPVPLRGGIERIDVAAFGRVAPMDMTSLTVAAHVAGHSTPASHVRDAARQVAAPLALIRTNGRLELWRVTATDASDERLGDADAADATELAGRFASVVAPDSLYAAKHGRQLSLLPTDVSLLAQAREGSSNRLSTLVEEAMITVLEHETHPPIDAWKEAAQLVVRTLAALVIRDKFHVTDDRADPFRTAESYFPQYFRQLSRLSRAQQGRLKTLADILGQGVNYAGLDPAVVSRVYETAVVSTASRVEHGIYYTPPELAERVVATLPFEEVPPQHRVVMDPACGSGTLLLAAHDRLAGLLPTRLEGGARHGYLVAHLIGYDSDPFAAEIASLSLLLHSMPFGNNWRIENRDALSGDAEATSPWIVMSNPPWRGKRSIDRKRDERATAFLRRMVELCQPGGFIAAILPATWLQSDVAQDSRAFLTNETALFEVWRLPEATFASAPLAPCVVFAQKDAPPRPWIYRRVRHPSLSQFLRMYEADEQWLQPPVVGAESLMRAPFDLIAGQLNDLPRLTDRAIVESSPVPTPGRRTSRGGDYWYLRRASSLRAYGATTEEELERVHYPDDFWRAGKERGANFRRQKVLVSAKRSPSNPWRLKAALDLLGVIPRESLHSVIPYPRGQTKTDVYALLALLGSRFASAWVDAFEPKRTIDIELLRNMPIPEPGAIWDVLTDLGRRLRRATDPDTTRDLAVTADRVIESAYRLPPSVQRSLDRTFAGEPAPEGGTRYPIIPTAPAEEGGDLNVFGAVLGVSETALRLWVPGVTPEQGVVTALPKRFPGWLCRDGSTFDIYGSSDLQSAEYRLQARAWMDFEDVAVDERGDP
jgi:hypothetical protein